MSGSGQQKSRGFFGRLLGGGRPAQEEAGKAVEELQPDSAAEADTSETGAEAVETAAPLAESEAATEAAVAASVGDAEVEASAETAGADETPAVAEPAVSLAAAAESEPPEAGAPAAKGGWFSRLKSGLQKTSARISDGITGLFTKSKLDADTIEDFEDLLLQADLGVETATRITDRISQGRFEKGIPPDEVRRILAEEVAKVLEPVAKTLQVDRANKPHVILMVGVNGTGKTTTIGKLAAQFAREGKKVMMAAGDTFRAAAIDQLKVWGERTGATVVAREVGADSAGLAYDALNQAKSGQYDVLLIDTAGRLQNKQALMEELEKVVRVIGKIDDSAPHECLLVLDATTGQNALNQVEVFRDRAGVSGLVMTKLDGTARGGILVSIAAKHKLPVYAIGVGEGVEDLQPFDAQEFARAIANG